MYEIIICSDPKIYIYNNESGLEGPYVLDPNAENNEKEINLQV